MESVRPGPENQRRVRCAACKGTFDTAAAGEGHEVTCPLCAETVRVGPAVRVMRRVRRSGVAPRHIEDADARLTRCPACRADVALGDRKPGDDATCPACAATFRVGERVRERQRVVRSEPEAADAAPAALVRIVRCRHCDHTFDADATADRCPSCGRSCRAEPEAVTVRGSRRDFWMGVLVGATTASLVFALLATIVALVYLDTRRR